MFRIDPIGGGKQLLDVAKVTASLVASLTDLQSDGVRYMATYPQQRAGSRYRRTGTLMRSWSGPPVKRTSDTIEAVIGSNGGIASYNADVEGDNQKPLFQALGWQNTNDLRRQLQAKMATVTQTAIAAGVVK